MAYLQYDKDGDLREQQLPHAACLITYSRTVDTTAIGAPVGGTGFTLHPTMFKRLELDAPGGGIKVLEDYKWIEMEVSCNGQSIGVSDTNIHGVRMTPEYSLPSDADGFRALDGEKRTGGAAVATLSPVLPAVTAGHIGANYLAVAGAGSTEPFFSSSFKCVLYDVPANTEFRAWLQAPTGAVDIDLVMGHISLKCYK